MFLSYSHNRIIRYKTRPIPNLNTVIQKIIKYKWDNKI